MIAGTIVNHVIGQTYSGVWLSTDGGVTWSRVVVPVDHGAADAISGLAGDGGGLVAVRPAATGGGAVVYVSADGRAWRYAATVAGGTGWVPGVVKGSPPGVVVTGTTPSGQVTAYTSTSTSAGTGWQPAGVLGSAADEAVVNAAVVPGGRVIAVGYGLAGPAGQQAVLEAGPAGAVRPVGLAGLPGTVVPELSVAAVAAAGGQQVAAGSADGYPAIWRRAEGGSWTLVSSLPVARSVAGAKLGALTSVTHGPRGWLAVGTPGPVVLTSPDGVHWAAAGGGIAADLAGAGSVTAAAGLAGYVIAARLTAPGSPADVWWSPDLITWTRAQDANDATGAAQVAAVAALPEGAPGFVSAGSHDGQPAVWTTATGQSWETVLLPVPAGAATAVLEQVAVNGAQVAALGQATMAGRTTTFAEVSADGGATWQPAAFPAAGPGTAITALTATAAGFTAAGLTGPPGQQHLSVWTSATGTTWTPAPAVRPGAAGTWQTTALTRPAPPSPAWPPSPPRPASKPSP